MNRILWALHFLASVVLIPALASGYELRPGRVRDPAGIQLFQTAVYNPEQDSYLLLYEDGRALVGHLSPGGVFSGETAISGNIGVTHVAAAYNPEDGTFLAVYRDGEPPEIYGRYLTGNGMPIGNSFFIGPGGAPHVAFSPESGRYVVTWEQLTSGFVRYRVINGNSTSGAPHVTAMSSVGGGLSDSIAYGSGPDKFLVVYVREAPGSKANVYGRFISANGQSVGPEFVVAGGTESQGVPRVAYAPTTNRFMVLWENWASCSGGCPHIRGALVASNGSVVKTFNVAVTAGWDQPGPLGYSSATNTFVTGWRSAYSDTRVEARAGEFSPVDGSLVRPTVLISDLNVGVEGLALRPDRTNPQAMFLTRLGFGGDGVHAGIVNLRGQEDPGQDPTTILPLPSTISGAGP